jgi:hypothetical protein
LLTILVMRFLLANASLSFSDDDDDVLVVGAVLVAVTAAAALGAIALMSLASFFLPSFAVGAVVVSGCFCTTVSDDVTAVTSKAAIAIEDATGTDWTSLLA